MHSIITDFFEKEKIEYFSIQPYSVQRVTGQYIIDRESFEPKSVIVYLLPYYTGETENISRYCASIDYHIAIREVNNRLIECLKSEFPDASFRGYGDHSPISECYAALIGGLGIAGDNGLLINEKYGTYVFIADVVTDIEPTDLGAIEPNDIRECMHCGACKRACPTGILRAEGDECLSAITQKKGELTENEAEMMRKYNTVWGCDLCQSACPYNSSPVKTSIEFFWRDRISSLTSELVASMDKDTFNKRAFAWRGRKTVERNLEIVKNKPE